MASLSRSRSPRCRSTRRARALGPAVRADGRGDPRPRPGRSAAPFSSCLRCSGVVADVAKRDIVDRLDHSPAATMCPSASAAITVRSAGRVCISSGWTTSSPGSEPRSGRRSGAHRPAPLGGGRPRCRMLDECDDAARHESCGSHRPTRTSHLADLDEATAIHDLDSASRASRGDLECPRIGSGVDDDLYPITLHPSTMRLTRIDRECPPCEEPPGRRTWRHERRRDTRRKRYHRAKHDGRWVIGQTLEVKWRSLSRAAMNPVDTPLQNEFQPKLPLGRGLSVSPHLPIPSYSHHRAGRCGAVDDLKRWPRAILQHFPSMLPDTTADRCDRFAGGQCRRGCLPAATTVWDSAAEC
jgi:hypothetical protein